jgi:hypothetical protein
MYGRPHLDKKFLFSRFSNLKEDEGRMLGWEATLDVGLQSAEHRYEPQ